MEERKESKTIRISRANYDKIVSLGDMTRTFDSVVSDILKNTNFNLLGASADTDKQTDSE